MLQQIIWNKKRIAISLIVLLLSLSLFGCGEKKTLEDGTYQVNVSMEGGSGRASVDSPTDLLVEDGKMTVKIVWSSPYYDYMIVGEETYYNESDGIENSTFTIPVAALDQEISVVADTTAMSTPHEISYTFTFTLCDDDV